MKTALVDGFPELQTADLRASLETGHESLECFLITALQLRRHGKRGGPCRPAQMRQTPQMRVVIVEAMRKSSVHQRGRER